MSSKSLFCLILTLPSLTNSNEPAKIPACPVLFKSFVDLKFLGINSEIFFQSFNLPKKSFIVLIPSSVVKTCYLGMFIFLKSLVIIMFAYVFKTSNKVKVYFES